MVKKEFKPKKSLGQNFFTNREKVRDIVELLDITLTDEVVEIGGGTGVFTKEIVNYHPAEFEVYEIDPELAKRLERLLSGQNASIHNENFLDAQIRIHGKDSIFNQWKVFGAIPYNITSPIIHKLMRTPNRPDTIVLIIQAEVADKLISKPPKGNYWSHLTAGYDISVEMKLSAEDFKPKPKVDSKIVLFKLVDHSHAVKRIGFDNWSTFLHHVFKNPRKMLNKAFDKNILEKIDIKSTDRPQNLTTQQIIELYDILQSDNIK